MPGTKAERWTLFMLLALALVLRQAFVHVPFMHDEISALIRLYPTLGETIRTGVMAQDTHPPGVQVFEWLWTHAFGDAEWVVKLPFILLSVAALFLLYRVACRWTSPTTALVTIALLATLQYFVLYGQLARPYAFGLFTTAWLADALTRYLDHYRKRDLIAYTLAAALSAYVHHFALLQAALIAGTGLLLVKPPQRRAYLLASLAAVVLYLPNVPIFLHQLEQGGLAEWLAPPGRFWLEDFGWWVAHCSWSMALVLAVLVGVSCWRLLRRQARSPHVIILICWGLIPLVVGAAYSIWRAPVLQYSVLIFSFPFLLMALLSGLPQLSRSRTGAMLGGIVTLTVITLVFNRQHYAVLGSSKYEAFARAIRDQAPGDLVLIHAPAGIMDFYARRWGFSRGDAAYVDLRTTPQDQVEAQVLAHTGDAVVIGLTAIAPVEWVSLVQARFPHTEGPAHLLEGSLQRFTRTPERTIRNDEAWGHIRWKEVYHPGEEAPSGRWNLQPGLPMSFGSTGDSTLLLDGREFSVGVRAPVDELIEMDNDIIELEAIVFTPHPEDFHVVAELTSDNTSLLYRSDRIEDHVQQADSSFRLCVAVKMSDFDRRGRSIQFHGYLWNKGLGPVRSSRMTVRVRAGNGRIYGLLGPLK
ncbi:MAG: glycosyltransferase family 39 protein [Flavobacteriales bacterium]|nr:glycosyltransferase family 39 protein [Flavobacteriales bacterium]